MNNDKLDYDKILTLFELVLNKGVRNNEFQNINTEIIAMELLSVFQGINWFCLFGDNKGTVKNYLKQSVEVILKGIRS